MRGLGSSDLFSIIVALHTTPEYKDYYYDQSLESELGGYNNHDDVNIDIYSRGYEGYDYEIKVSVATWVDMMDVIKAPVAKVMVAITAVTTVVMTSI